MIRIIGYCFLFLCSCSSEPQPINYGHDACHFCQMIIVDQAHAAQMITDKGKAYKYDATECMMQHLASWQGPLVDQVLVTDYITPGTLINAKEAHYLFSEHIPSPMGAFLSSFYDKDQLASLSQQGDQSVNWLELSQQYKVSADIFKTPGYER